MGFVNFVISIVSIVIFVAIFIVAAVFSSGVALVIISAVLALGWIPIVMCATDVIWTISFSGGFFPERAAAYATVFYLMAGGLFAFIWLAVPDGRELPHGLKSLSFLFPHPAEGPIRDAAATRTDVDAEAVADGIRTPPPKSDTGNRMRAHRARKATKKAEAEAERDRADAELADATAEMKRAKARLKQAEERARK